MSKRKDTKDPSESNVIGNPLSRRDFIKIASVAAGAAAVSRFPGSALAAPSNQLDKPIISCASSTENTIELQVCAGATGAAAGFSVQWMTCADYAANGNMWYASDDDRLCKASFSGNANGTSWNLGPNGCVNVVIGGLNDADPGVSFTCNEALECDTCYVFHAFAHNVPQGKKKSDFTANLECDTAACPSECTTCFEDGDFCTRSQGYFGSGADSLSAEIACFGGFNGAYDKNNNQTQAPNTGTCGATLLTIGGGTFSYKWQLTCVYEDVDNSPSKFWLDTGLKAMRDAIGGGGGSGYFTQNGTNEPGMGGGGGLASQTAALTLNLHSCLGDPAFANAVLCEFQEGDTFKNDGTPISEATAIALNGQTVAQVLAAANAYLGGNGADVPYSLTSAADLNELVANLNLAFDGKDWAGCESNCDCGGMSAFAKEHLRTSCAG